MNLRVGIRQTRCAMHWETTREKIFRQQTRLRICSRNLTREATVGFHLRHPINIAFYRLSTIDLTFNWKIRSTQHVSTFVLKLMIFWSSTFPIICRHTFPQLASKAGRCNADNWQAIDLSLLRRRRRQRRPRLRETCACVRVEPSRHYWICAEIVRSSVPRNTRKQTWLTRRTQPQANIGWCSIAFQYLASLQNAWQFVKQIFNWVNYAIVDVKLCNRRCLARFRTRPFCK